MGQKIAPFFHMSLLHQILTNFQFCLLSESRKICNNVIRFHYNLTMSLHYLVSCKSTKTRRFVDRAIGQWRRWLKCVVQQKGGHTKHLV